MTRLHLIAFVAVAFASGCRTTADDFEPTSLDPVTRLREANAFHVQPVAYQQEPDGPRPQADGASRGSRRPHKNRAAPETDAPDASAFGSRAEALPAPPPTHVEMVDLTLAELEGMALQNNPALAQAAARVEAARGHWRQVGLPPNPSLAYSGQEIGDEGSAGKQGGFIAQEFITGGKLRLDRQAADWQVQSLQRELQATRLRVLTDVRIGYYDVLIAQRRRELTAQLLRISQQGAQAAQALFKSGEVSQADPLRAQVEADTTGILLQNSINQHVEARQRLAAVLDVPTGWAEKQLPPVVGELNPDQFRFSWQEELQRLLAQSPELAAAMADVEAARWAVDRAHAEVIPNVNVQAAVQKDFASGDTIAGLQIQLPIPLINRNQGGIQQAQAEAAATQRAVERLALDLQARLASAFQRYQSALNQVEQYSRQGGILANSRRTLELLRAGYQAEEFDVLDLLTAQRTYFQTNLAYLDSLRELWASAMEIRGLLLKGSLSK